MLFKIQIPEIQPQKVWVIRPEMKPGNQHWEWAQPVMLMWVVHGPHFEEFWPRWTFAWSCVLGNFKKFILVGGFAWVIIYCMVSSSLSTRQDTKTSFSRITSDIEALKLRYCPVLWVCVWERVLCVCVLSGKCPVAMVLSTFHASLKGFAWCVPSGTFYQNIPKENWGESCLKFENCCFVLIFFHKQGRFR